MLVSIVVCAQAFDREGRLWALLPATVGQNHELMEALGRIIASNAVVFSAPDNAPIWEREAMDAFLAAEAGADWGAIRERWDALDHLLHPNALHAQCIRCLFHFDRSRLIGILTTVQQTAVAMLISRILAWCDRDPQTRYPFAAAIGSIFRQKNGEHPTEWKALARTLLAKAPDKVPVFTEIVSRLQPTGGTGSLSSQYESRLKLLNQLDIADMPELVGRRAAAQASLQAEVDSWRKRETDRDRERSSRFE